MGNAKWLIVLLLISSQCKIARCQLGFHALELGVGVNQSLRILARENQERVIEQNLQPRLSLETDLLKLGKRILVCPTLSLERLDFRIDYSKGNLGNHLGNPVKTASSKAFILNGLIRVKYLFQHASGFYSMVHVSFGGFQSIGFKRTETHYWSELTHTKEYPVREALIGFGASIYVNVWKNYDFGIDVNSMRYLGGVSTVSSISNPMNFMLKLRRTIKGN